MTFPALANMEWTVREKYAAIRTRKRTARPQRDSLTRVADMLGVCSQTLTLVALAGILAGPFTWLTSWVLTYYISLAGLPVHLLALVLGIGTWRRKRPKVRSSVGGICGIIRSGLGFLLATLVLALAHSYVL